MRNKNQSAFRLLFRIFLLQLPLLFLFTFVHSLKAQSGNSAPAKSFWLWQFLGRLHPMIVHFPISLLIAAFLFELVLWKKKSASLFPAIKILVILGAIASVISVVFGLILANNEEYGSATLPLHQWLGIGTMIAAAATAFSYSLPKRGLQKFLLLITVCGVTLAGHFGAELTHGDDYLSSVLPGNHSVATESSDSTLNAEISFASQKGPLTEDQLLDLNLQVRTVLAHNCYSCHGAGKVKGELRLDSREAIFKGGKDGAVIVPGNPEKSDLIKRIKLPRRNKNAMPSKGNALSSKEIELLEFWVQQGAPWPKGPLKSLYRVASMAPRLPEMPAASERFSSPIDKFVNAYFEKNKFALKEQVNDRIYIRRVYLDVIGLLPSPDSIDAFILDPRPEKKERLVTNLLARNDDYAQHWLTFWNDALRNDYTGTGYITNGRSDITKWLYSSLQVNKPYNEFVRELISPDSPSLGFIRGIQWRGVVNASQRPEMQAAQNVSQVFLGLNLKCSSCHDSFISDWKLDDSYAFANMFSDSAMEVFRCDKPTGRMAARRPLYAAWGDFQAAEKKKDRLKELADKMIQPADGRLYRTVVNRIWAQLMGRGIVEPVDAMDMAPWSQDLLDWLAWDFVADGYDIKKLIHKILLSKTYQLPSVSAPDANQIFAPAYTFRGMVRRRLTAEEFSDAVSQSLQHMYQDSMIVYDLLPASIKNKIPFARASLVKNDRFLTALGRPNRETVSTSRASQANLLQALELTNGTLFDSVLKRGSERWKQLYTDPKKLVRAVYRSTLGREPLPAEEETAAQALGKTPGQAAIQDFIWSMALHPEFQLIY